MSWITDLFSRLFGGGKKKPHAHYYDKQKGKHSYWRRDTIAIYIDHEFGANSEVHNAFAEWRDVQAKDGIRLELTLSESAANIVIDRGDAVQKGGVTHRNFSKTDKREIAWAKIVIASGEKGDRLKAVALHELFHAFGLSRDHSGASEADAGHSKAIVTSLSDADETTAHMMNVNRPDS